MRKPNSSKQKSKTPKKKSLNKSTKQLKNKSLSQKTKSQENNNCGWSGSSIFSQLGGNKKSKKKKMTGGGWGIPRTSNYMVGGSRKRHSYKMKGGWGEDEVRPETKNKSGPRKSLNSLPRIENKNIQSGGGWGGARTIRYDINAGRSSVVNKYFKRYFH